jgi:hypothetical protein
VLALVPHIKNILANVAAAICVHCAVVVDWQAIIIRRLSTASANNQGEVERNDQRSLAQHGHFRFDQLRKTFV